MSFVQHCCRGEGGAPAHKRSQNCSRKSHTTCHRGVWDHFRIPPWNAVSWSWKEQRLSAFQRILTSLFSGERNAVNYRVSWFVSLFVSCPPGQQTWHKKRIPRQAKTTKASMVPGAFQPQIPHAHSKKSAAKAIPTWEPKLWESQCTISAPSWGYASWITRSEAQLPKRPYPKTFECARQLKISALEASSKS